MTALNFFQKTFLCKKSDTKVQVLAKHLFLNISDACNLRCDVCYGHLAAGQKQNMSLETAKLATDFFYNNRDLDYKYHYIMFFGGEPLLNFDIIEPYLIWFKEKYKNFNCRFFIFTNGVLLDKDKINFLLKNSIDIFISFDNDKEYYTSIKTGIAPYYEQIEESIKYIVKTQSEAFTIYYIIHTENIDKLDDFCNYMKALGVKNIGITREIFTSWTETDKQKTEEILNRHRDEFDKILIYPEILASCFDCYSQNIIIYPNGEVYDCCLLSGCSLSKYCSLTNDFIDNIFKIGNIFINKPPMLNIEAKSDLIHNNNVKTINSFCPTLNPDVKEIEHFWIKKQQ